jgi:hypothetical protein
MPLGQSQDMPSPSCLEEGSPSVLISPNPLSALHRRFACARLSHSCLSGFSATFTTLAFDGSSSRWLENNTCLPTSKVPSCAPKNNRRCSYKTLSGLKIWVALYRPGSIPFSIRTFQAKVPNGKSTALMSGCCENGPKAPSFS